jgi:hypothetical protein
MPGLYGVNVEGNIHKVQEISFNLNSFSSTYGIFAIITLNWSLKNIIGVSRRS